MKFVPCKVVIIDVGHTKYAAPVSSGNSPLEPRCARLYGREVCKGRFEDLWFMLGKRYVRRALECTKSSSRVNTKVPANVERSDS